MKAAFPVALVMLIATACPAQSPDSWVGKRVFTKYGARLQVGNTVVDDEKLSDNLLETTGKARRRHRIYRVEHVNGDWLWIKDENSSLAGWVESKWVIPYDQAIDYYTKELRANPSPVKYGLRATIWSDKGEYNLAIADLNEAIRLDPRHEDSYYNRGNIWMYKNDYDRAIADYDEAIRLDPKLVSAYRNRARAWFNKNDYDRAIADYSVAIRLDPKYAWGYNDRAGAWFNKNDYDRAIADYDEAIRLDPKFASAYNNRGNAWNSRKNYDRAIADYGEAIRLDPKLATAYNGRGVAWENKNDYDRAIADYGEAIRLEPKYARAYNNRGIARGKKKDYDRAIADYGEAIRLDPKYALAYNYRAWLWATCPEPEFRDGKKAVESATKACELSKWKERNDLDTLAASYAETGDFDQAVKWEEKAIALTPESEAGEKKARNERLALYRNGKPYHQP